MKLNLMEDQRLNNIFNPHLNGRVAGSAQPVYRLENVAKAYHGRQVLEVDRLEIQQGEILALVGPSGAGKSTLLRLLNFLEPPSQGAIRFHDAEFAPDKDIPLDLRRKVTMVFQRPMLLNRSIRENVAFGLALRDGRGGISSLLDSLPFRQPRMTGPVLDALEEVGLAGMAHAKACNLSGGEAQRVALARAMVLRPEVLLLDEPTANLDPYNVGLIEKIALDLNRVHHTTLVLVTHNVFQARRLAHRVAFLLDGRVIEVADADTFFNHPADPRTAAFARGEMVY